MVEVILTGRPAGDELRGARAETGAWLGRVGSVRLPLSEVARLASSPRVSRIQLSRELIPLLDKATTEADAVAMWGAPAPRVRTGRVHRTGRDPRRRGHRARYHP